MPEKLKFEPEANPPDSDEPVTGDRAVPKMPENACEPAPITEVVLEFFERITERIATPMIAVKTTITPLTS